ncbi:hypothetical protein P59_181 [Bacillus phage P59]|nr:hypothetical protein P59_181 [Bacillus phage P59]
MALTVFAVAYKYEEDVFVDFAKGEDSYDLEPSCFLPTRSMAEEIIEDQLSDNYGVVEITIESVRNGVWSWSRDAFEPWDSLYDEDEDC